MAIQSNLFGLKRFESRRGLSLGRPALKGVSTGAIAAAIAVLGLVPQGQTQGYDTVPPLPVGALPVPGAAPVSGQQYLIYVNDTSETTLRQVRTVEPTAFRTSFQGRSVIQAGRFNMSGNAQQRIADLSALGVRAEMAQVAAAVPSFAQTPALPNNVYASNGDLPPLPDTAFPGGGAGVPVPALPPSVAQVPPAPGNVEFGQELNYGAPALPPDGAGVMMPPPNAAPPTESFSVPSAPYYVVIPTDTSNLGTLSSQVIQLGTPPDRVQQRTAPRGPHVAVGPFTDRALANRWNNFYRDAGIGNSRVHFER